MRTAFLTLCVAGSICSTGHGQTLSGPTVAPSRYAVGGLALGDRMPVVLSDYECNPSEQFGRLIWCTQTRVEHKNDREVTSVNSILYRQEDQKVVYVNRAVFPEHFDRNEFDRVVETLSKRYGETAQVKKLANRTDTPDAIIAFWGIVKLIELDDRDSLNVLRSGGHVTQGILVDLLGDYARSVKHGLPIYRLSGGAGYVWAATRNREGLGHVRFFAINVAEFSPAMARDHPEPGPPPQPDTRRQDTPDACRKFPQLCY